MKTLYLMAEFLATPWAMQPERVSLIAGVLARWAIDRPASSEIMEQVRADHAAVEARAAKAVNASRGNVAVLPLYGTIVQRGSAMDDVSGTGMMGLSKWTKEFNALINNPAVAGIVIDVDSPGGSVYGVQEAAAEIMAARAKKPVYAVANSLAASAAYWLASAASELYVTPGGEAGSIGVYTAHRDVSAAMEQEGVKTTLISAGKYKVEGSPFGPLSDEARAAMQSRIDSYYSAFVNGVAKGRGVNVGAVTGGMGQGRVLGASDAVTAGMADGVMTLDEVIGKMSKAVSGPMGVKSGRTARARKELDILSANF